MIWQKWLSSQHVIRTCTTAIAMETNMASATQAVTMETEALALPHKGEQLYYNRSIHESGCSEENSKVSVLANMITFCKYEATVLSSRSKE